MATNFTRRNLLKGVGAGAIGAASLGGIQSALSGFQAAQAADVSHCSEYHSATMNFGQKPSLTNSLYQCNIGKFS